MKFTLSDKPSRIEAIEFISGSSIYGNLGLFVGAGFSKAVMNNGAEKIALSWGELLEKVSKELDIGYEEIKKEGSGYPEIASSICVKYSEKKNCSYTEALSQLKKKIASLTGWYPNKENRDRYSKFLIELDLSWIITTNYDSIIESLLTGKSIPLGPEKSLSAPKEQTPVYHLHGNRTNPEGIIIAQEDYVSLFRPNEYRQIKLALTIIESTTLLVGYGLGDVNVLTAIDWSKNVFVKKEKNYPHDVIQVVCTQKPKKEPYRDRNEILIIETLNLADFFDEYIKVHDRLKKEKEKTDKKLTEISNFLKDPKKDLIKIFIDDKGVRRQILDLLKTSPSLILSFISFLDNCIDEMWLRAEPKGAFEAYNQYLTIVLDILTILEVEQIPPALLEACAYALERVAGYIGLDPGMSWDANKTFEERKGELSQKLVSELNYIAKQHGYKNLQALIKRTVAK